MKLFALAAVAAAIIATPAFAQEYRRATGFEQVKNECEIIADQALFAATGRGLGWALQGAYHARAYDQCMMAKGYARNQ
jgi:hypothetical protein